MNLMLFLEKAMAPHSSTLAWKIPWDGGAWWAAVCGVAQSWTRLKRLSSSSSEYEVVPHYVFDLHFFNYQGF